MPSRRFNRFWRTGPDPPQSASIAASFSWSVISFKGRGFDMDSIYIRAGQNQISSAKRQAQPSRSSNSLSNELADVNVIVTPSGHRLIGDSNLGDAFRRRLAPLGSLKQPRLPSQLQGRITLRVRGAIMNNSESRPLDPKVRPRRVSL
jgi:hypothetical protein